MHSEATLALKAVSNIYCYIVKMFKYQGFNLCKNRWMLLIDKMMKLS